MGERGEEKTPYVHYWVPINRISPYVVKAVIIAEDDKFWRHEGFDYEAIQKALEKDLKKKSIFGGRKYDYPTVG